MVVDANGGIYFTDSGNFEEDLSENQAVGAVYYITPAGELIQVDTELVYPTTLSPDEKTLYVTESGNGYLYQISLE
jgi:sugar lactone lactonase YvrE